jgi:prepilin-type N-terminal cleavage/methylation domain-containing protein
MHKQFHNSFLESRRGFSLIEVMIVVGIIGLLTTFLIIGGLVWQENAKTKNTEAKLTLLESTVEAYHAKMSRYFNGSVKTTGAVITKLDKVDATSSLIGAIINDKKLIPWVIGTAYTQAIDTERGSIVFLEDDNKTYQCIDNHTANASNKPGTSGGKNYWQYEPVLDAWDNPIRCFNPNPISDADNDPDKPYFWSFGPDGVNDTNIPLNYDETNFPSHWKDDEPYSSGNVVLYNGSFYKCSQSHTSSDSKHINDADYWTKLDDIGTFK